MRTLIVSSTLFLAFAVFANAHPHHPMPPHKQAAKDKCMKKLDLNEDQLHGGMDKNENDKNRSCFMACMDKELGLMTEEGTIDRDEALKDFPPFFSQENRTKVVDACFEEKGADDCETAQLYHDCVEKLKPRPPMNPEMKKARDSCKEKLNLSDGDIEKLEKSMGEVDKNCFVACTAKSLGYTNEDGTLNKVALVEKVPPHLREETQKTADNCANEKGAEECETAALLIKCFKKSHVMMMAMFGPPPPHPHRNQGD